MYTICKCKVNLSNDIKAMIGERMENATINIQLDEDVSIVVKAEDLVFLDWDTVDGEENAEQDTREIDSSTNPVASIFSENLEELDRKYTQRTNVDRLASTKVPSSKAERQYAIKTREEIESKNDFVEKHPELKNPKVRSFISNANEFFAAVDKSKNKKSEIDLDSIANIREKAVAMEAKETQESIGITSFVVNEKYGSLMINDLGINLLLNSPLDLSRISAKRLHASTDLRNMLANNIIRFVSPDEAVALIKKATNPSDEDSSVPVFDNHRQAQRNMGDGDDEPFEVDLDQNIDDESTEQSRLILQTRVGDDITNLTSRGVRKSVHGTSSQSRMQPKVQPKQNSSPSSKNKPIARKF